MKGSLVPVVTSADPFLSSFFYPNCDWKLCNYYNNSHLKTEPNNSWCAHIGEGGAAFLDDNNARG